jgi:hypothetical protein
MMEKVAALLVLALLVCTPALGESGTSLLQACEALEREVHISGDRVTLPARGDVQPGFGDEAVWVHDCTAVFTAINFTNRNSVTIGHVISNLVQATTAHTCSERFPATGDSANGGSGGALHPSETSH